VDIISKELTHKLGSISGSERLKDVNVEGNNDVENLSYESMPEIILPFVLLTFHHCDIMSNVEQDIRWVNLTICRNILSQTRISTVSEQNI
jgi:hypothetical protein